MQHISARGRRRGTEIFAEQSDDLGRSSGAMYRRAELSGSGARGEVTEGQDCGRFRAQNLRVQFLGFEDCASDGYVGEPARICSLSPTQESCAMACPGLTRGQVRVELYEPQNVTKFIQAHDSPLRCVVLSLDGSLVATASEKGTLVRVFDCHSGCLLHEFRRGTDRAKIYSLAFSKEKEWLVCTSDKGTVHVYRMPEGSIAGGGNGTTVTRGNNSSDNIASYHYQANGDGYAASSKNSSGYRAPAKSNDAKIAIIDVTVRYFHGRLRECFTEIFTSGTVVRAVSNEQKRRRLYWKLRKDRRSNERVSGEFVRVLQSIVFYVERE